MNRTTYRHTNSLAPLPGKIVCICNGFHIVSDRSKVLLNRLKTRIAISAEPFVIPAVWSERIQSNASEIVTVAVSLNRSLLRFRISTLDLGCQHHSRSQRFYNEWVRKRGHVTSKLTVPRCGASVTARVISSM